MWSLQYKCRFFETTTHSQLHPGTVHLMFGELRLGMQEHHTVEYEHMNVYG